MAAHARLKNEFTEDEKYHNLMRWLILYSDQGIDLFLCRMEWRRIPQPRHDHTQYRQTGKEWGHVEPVLRATRLLTVSRYEPRHEKTNKMSMRPVKTQISLGIHPVWLESSQCAQWVAKDPSFLHADSEDSDQTGRMPILIWVFARRTVTLLVLSCRGAYVHYEDYNVISTTLEFD